MDISVIIVNYNTCDHLSACLDSILNFTKNLKYEVIVVDNNSSDREIEIFPARYPSVEFFFNNTNKGFGAGCNFGAGKSNSKYLLFINPDIILINNVIYELFEIMESDTLIGVTSPVYEEDNGRISYTYNKFPNLKWEFLESLGFGVDAEIDRLTKVKEIVTKTIFEVDWLMGSFLLVRTDIFRKIGGFDERIFLYYEDVDLQYRIKDAGYKIICCPQSKVHHYKRSSVRSLSGENIYYFHMTRSHMIYMYLHFKLLKRNFVRFMRINGILFRLLFLTVRKKFSGKKRQKLFQYKLMLGLYLSSERQITDMRTFENKEFYTSQNNSHYDKFWN